MPKTIEFLFDFGSPNAYLAHLVIPEIERRTGAKFDYVPILLGDNSKFVAATGWQPTIPFEQTLRDMLEYWRSR